MSGTNGKRREFHVFLLPVAVGAFAALTLPTPLTEDEWGRLPEMLEAMRPGLVIDEPIRWFVDGRDPSPLPDATDGATA